MLILGLGCQVLQPATGFFQTYHIVLPQIGSVWKALKNIVFAIQ